MTRMKREKESYLTKVIVSCFEKNKLIDFVLRIMHQLINLKYTINLLVVHVKLCSSYSINNTFESAHTRHKLKCMQRVFLN